MSEDKADEGAEQEVEQAQEEIVRSLNTLTRSVLTRIIRAGIGFMVGAALFYSAKHIAQAARR